ncbi:MAG: hypothetical protein M3T56_01285, partial [Chloroflexota bacterium]|nr:hypothetical protein [Chloroflexota bacterium]
MTRLSRTPAWIRALAVGGVLLVVGFGDGLGYSLAKLTGQRSPWIFLLPVLGVPVLLYVASQGPQAIRRADKALLAAFSAFALVVLGTEALFVRDFYLAGLLQLITFVASIIVVRAIFVSAPSWLAAALRRSIIPAHFFLCGYVIVAYLTWQIACVDPSLLSVLTGSSARAVEYYGFRPSGFDLEPQWTAMALAASYIGVHYLVSHRRATAFVALAAASAVLASATAAIFVLAVVATFVVNELVVARRTGGSLAVLVRPLWTAAAEVRQWIGRAFLVLVVGTAAVLAGTVALGAGSIGCHLPASAPSSAPASPTAPASGTDPQSSQVDVPPAIQVPLERITNIVGGRDPSTSQRIISAGVAARVIEQSFPVGVGYGNFRRYAEYPQGFEAYVANIAEDTRYKSDSFVLNYVAELGLLGLVLVTWVAALFVNGRHGLP